MPSLPITNVVTISVSSPPAGVADYKVNNLAIFSKETPVNVAITANNPGVYKTPTDVATDWGTGSEVYAQANLIFSQKPNILNGGGELIVFPMQSGDTLATNIPLAVAVAPFFGVLYAGYAPNDAEVIAAAAITEPLRIKLFASSHLTSSLTPSTGLIAILTASNYKHARGLLYTLGALALNARKMAAAYAGRAMSVNFEGNATTSTMHLKDLVGILPDTNITQTILGSIGTPNTAQAAGADVYCSIAGVAKVFSSGANDFFDNVYNTDWLVFSLQVAGFNALATTSTKLPQTEPGIAVLRGAYINVLNLAVRNSFLAPGAWNSSELFGNPADLIRNVAQLGFYIYSTPVNQQTQASRVARQAPLIQIAVKFAGAVHSTSVVVSVNP